VVSTPLDEMPDKTYALIMANLRPPTLRALFSRMARVARAPSNWVLSGFRPEEGKDLLDFLEKMGASLFWWKKENGWAAMVARLNSQALGDIDKGD
jgi:ribosomal protein L11 methylase PrmA